MDLTTPAGTFDLGAHAARIERDGYTVLPDLLDAKALEAVRAALAPHLGGHLGRNAFEGYATERVYTLVARGKVFEDLTEHPQILALLDRFLLPGYLLTASQAIAIQPGEAAQSVHFDDGFYRLPRPRPAASLSVIIAIDPFTDQNGATDLLPGSHLWSDAEVEAFGRAPDAASRLMPAIMPAGSAIVFQGHMLHRGGANRSAAPRLALTNQYCQPWGRTQENYFLSVPRAQVRAMSPRLQALLGYEIWPPFMGHVTASHPRKVLEDGWVPPVLRPPVRP
ncbi:phytanoyl-CoA dioxygenase family protein [Phenylobacterium sp.]|uniref:phytanoyl-CoA dioxygenase family protein n=1 Tax=Phenylobacterium sp. TaxID=1871053 RepID=UPI00272F3F6E|nr:phytanoyl-CoA dioxygenase family protein [Phenylobacterium sp.]MDP2215140.1 phytanoyl-CoA dioxygenase family protein [Phenylobacterium sp.]